MMTLLKCQGYHLFCHPDPLKVGSRRVIQWAALIMILFGLFCKFGAVFVTIPTPIVGGLFMVMFGLVSAVGLSNLQVGIQHKAELLDEIYLPKLLLSQLARNTLATWV